VWCAKSCVVCCWLICCVHDMMYIAAYCFKYMMCVVSMMCDICDVLSVVFCVLRVVC